MFGWRSNVRRRTGLSAASARVAAVVLLAVFSHPVVNHARSEEPKGKPSKLDRVLRKAVDGGTTSEQRVIIRTRRGQTSAVADRLRKHGDRVESQHHRLDAFTATVHADDLRALAIDQRGFGESDRPESGYSIPEMADDAIAFLDALGIPRATVVGHSFGSFVARRAAIAHPDRVTALALIGTGLSGSNAVTRELQSSLRDLPDPIPVQFARDFQASTAFRPIPPDFFERIIEESLKLPPRLWRLAIDRLIECDDAKELSRIEAPTQLLWGDKDALFSRTEQQRFIDLLPAARLSVYEETGHCPNWEQPERVAADIMALAAQA